LPFALCLLPYLATFCFSFPFFLPFLPFILYPFLADVIGAMGSWRSKAKGKVQKAEGKGQELWTG
jgi:hypothetical protein